MRIIIHILTIASGVLGFVSVILAIKALWDAKKQTEKMNESLERSNEITSHLQEQAESIKIQTHKMEETNEQTKKIMLNLETRHINPFPDNFDDIDSLLSYCQQDAPDFCRKRIEIFTDFAGYGILSKHSNWRKFHEKIEKIITEGHVEVFWCFYTGDLRNEHITKQFESLKTNLEERKKYVESCFLNISHECAPIEYPTCKHKSCFVRPIYDTFTKADISYEDIIKLLETLEDMEENNIDLLVEKPNTRLKVKKLKEKNEVLPYFGWFVYEERILKGEKIFKPIKAMISFPYYAERIEEGLFTKHQGIMEAFRSKLPKYENGLKVREFGRFD